MNAKTNYRPDLDGLRAVAVLSVLFYHAKTEINGSIIFKGGYLGVDVFFVLSGFLISLIIIKSVAEGQFSYSDFFIKRAKRIIPALFFVLFFTSVLAYKILLPDAFMAYGKSLASACLFISNFFFYSEDPYVSSASDLKPLLHTWSLSVEWQFYIIFPIILVMLINAFRDKLIYFILLLFTLSFIFALYQTKYNLNYSFYMLPTRSWELLIGAVTAIKIISKKNKKHDWIFSLIGFLAIIGSMLFVDDKRQHPSFVTLIPVVGTCLVIYFNSKMSVIYKLLSLSPFVFIGAVSYSLYLVHQPLFAFYRIIYGEINLIEGLLLISASFLLAILSYFLIEKKFRNQSYNWSKKSLGAVTFVSLMSFSYFIYATEGDVKRLSKRSQEDYVNFKEPEFRRLIANTGRNFRTGKSSNNCELRDPYEACHSGDQSWVTIGDSYAATFDFYLSRKLSTLGKGLLSLTYEQCPFVNGIWFGNVPECTEVNKRRWKIIEGFKNKKTIFIATNYYFFRAGKKEILKPLEGGKKNLTFGESIDQEIVWESFSYNVNKLVAMGHTVILVYPIPSVTEDVKAKYFSLLKKPSSNFNNVIYENKKDGEIYARRISKKLDSLIVANENIKKLKPVDMLCDNNGCQIINQFGGLYNGGSHLSHAGVELVAKNIFQD